MLGYLFIAILDLLTSVTIALRCGPSWRLAALALHGSISLYAIASSPGANVSEYFLRASIATKFFATCHFLWFTDPFNDYRHERDEIHPQERSFLYRVYWAACLMSSHRGIGTKRQLPYTPPLPLESRWNFLKKRSLRVLALFIISDVVNVYISINPAFSPSSTCGSPVTCQGRKVGMLNTLIFAAAPYAVINLGYDLISVLAVASGISEPKYWPDFFGSPSELCTVRRFWGRFWHQMMRPFLTSISQAVARSLGFSPGTTLSAYTQTFVAFAISGIIHVAGDIHMDNGHKNASLKFFTLQAFAIAFEDAVMAIAKGSGLGHSKLFNRLVGYSWVGFWFYLFVPYLMKWCVDSGSSQEVLFPFSPSRMAVGFATKHYGLDLAAFFKFAH